MAVSDGHKRVIGRGQLSDGTWVDTLECKHTYHYEFRHPIAKKPYNLYRRCGICDALKEREGRGRPRIQIPEGEELARMMTRYGPTKLARQLKCDPQTLYNRLKKYRNKVVDKGTCNVDTGVSATGAIN